jgi:hypothetical protein
MEERGGDLSDEDVEVTEVDWVAFDELEDRLAYADERRLVRKALELHALRVTDGGVESTKITRKDEQDLPVEADGG